MELWCVGVTFAISNFQVLPPLMKISREFPTTEAPWNWVPRYLGWTKASDACGIGVYYSLVSDVIVIDCKRGLFVRSLGVLGLPCAAGSSTAPLLTEHAKLIDSVETFIFDCDGIFCFFTPAFLLWRLKINGPWILPRGCLALLETQTNPPGNYSLAATENMN